jgi:drug/metabolite transporter (DMT)-like permease
LPLSSTAIAVGLLGETLTTGHLIAFACAVGGILLIATAPQGETQRSAPGD